MHLMVTVFMSINGKLQHQGTLITSRWYNTPQYCAQVADSFSSCLKRTVGTMSSRDYLKMERPAKLSSGCGRQLGNIHPIRLSATIWIDLSKGNNFINLINIFSDLHIKLSHETQEQYIYIHIKKNVACNNENLFRQYSLGLNRPTFPLHALSFFLFHQLHSSQ